MNHQQLITDLEEVTQQLGIQIRYEKGDFDGGYCVLKAQKVLVVNKRLTDARRASAIAQALSEYGLDNIFVKPNIRAYIEDEAARAARKA
jgi:hypothetical protein